MASVALRRLSSLLILTAALAGGAAAQSLDNLTAQQNEARAAQQAADQRAIAQRNELEARDAKAQTEARLQQLPGLKPPAPTPDPVYAPTAAPEPVPADQLAADYPSIPDAVLAASRARVLQASANRR